MPVTFYCRECDSEQDREPYPGLYRGEKYWWTKCKKCRRKLIRYVDNKNQDPYFRLSPKLRRERQEYSKDLIQPGQTGFKTLYPKSHRAIQEAEERGFKAREETKRKKMKVKKMAGLDRKLNKVIDKLYDE